MIKVLYAKIKAFGQFFKILAVTYRKKIKEKADKISEND